LRTCIRPGSEHDLPSGRMLIQMEEEEEGEEGRRRRRTRRRRTRRRRIFNVGRVLVLIKPPARQTVTPAVCICVAVGLHSLTVRNRKRIILQRQAMR